MLLENRWWSAIGDPGVFENKKGVQKSHLKNTTDSTEIAVKNNTIFNTHNDKLRKWNPESEVRVR